ncbi:MAG TPA: AEC family transporter [Stellaceae bacterium]|nr:AEC family transporter [Stellaceae bacterium]
MFEAVISTIVPVLGCTLTGYLLVRSGLIASGAVEILNQLVYYASFPALLFTFLARTPIARIWQQDFLETWTLSLAVIYGLTFVVSRLFWRGGTVEASVRAMNCSCASTAFIGIPVLVIALGKDGALPAILATTVIVTIFFGLTFAVIESARHGIAASGRALASTARSLLRNPLMLGVVFGAFSSAFLTLPKPVLALGELVGSAAIPCSLMTIGIFIAGLTARESVAGTIGPTVIKLVVHPLVTWGIVRWVIRLDPTWAAAAMLLSALPPATSCFVIAKQYDILVAETSGAIWLSTVLSIVSVVAVLFFMGIRP